MDRLGIEFISVFGQPPVDFIELAAKLDCRNIGMATAPVVALPNHYPAWNLREDRQLLRDTAQALKDNGVTVVLGEGFLIMPGADIGRYAADLDIMAELGARRVNLCCVEANVGEFARFADMAAERGLPVTVEFLPGLPVGSFEAASDFLAQAGRSNTAILVDSMHFFASGGTVEKLAGADPALIGHAQLCDMAPPEKMGDYTEVARFERPAPGDGVLPLVDFVRALPKDVIIGLEAPLRSLAEKGVGPEERLRPVIEKARAVLAAAG